MKNINPETKGTWLIKFGYCTGNPLAGNDGWFTTETLISNENLGEALFEARKSGYNISGDICADFLFSVTNFHTGILVDGIDTCQAMVEATRILVELTE